MQVSSLSGIAVFLLAAQCLIEHHPPPQYHFDFLFTYIVPNSTLYNLFFFFPFSTVAKSLSLISHPHPVAQFRNHQLPHP
ncbi:hypothetical protein GGR51DRAFT_512426, partial [Nemania sp. FL0031]